jgi:xylulokinase
VLDEGDGFVSLGTSGVVLVARNTFNPAPESALHTFCHAVPDQWYQMGVMLSATDSLNWLSRITNTSPTELTRALGADPQSPSTERFLPYLSGERTPHNDAQIRGGFSGLSTSTSRDDLTRAVLEGVSFGLKDSLEALKATGCRVDVLSAIGGGTASSYWLKLLATILGLPLKVPEGGEFGAALGAARLAKIAATNANPSDVIRAPSTYTVIHPNTDHLAAFEDAYAKFQAAYSGFKAIQ